jgi:hypothetical protein
LLPKVEEKMQIYRVGITVSDNGTLLIKNLPFQAGDKVEVVVRSRKPKLAKTKQYPLRGTPIEYLNPFESVAENAWGVLS